MTYTFFPSAPASKVRGWLSDPFDVVDLPDGEGALIFGHETGWTIQDEVAALVRAGWHAAVAPSCFRPTAEVEALIELARSRS